MPDTLPKLLQEIHSVSTPSDLNTRFPEFQSRIATILFEQPSEENYYVNHTGRELFRKLYNYGLEHLITDPYDSGFRPILESGIQTFTVTVNGDNGTETGGGEKEIGSTINITATPNALYQFDSWTVVGPGQIGSTTSANTTFTVGAGDVTITANYSIVPAPSLSGSFTDPNVSLTASVVNGTAAYQFQRSTSPNFSSDLTTVQNTASNTLSDPLSSAGTYYYRVRSVNGSTQTAWSDAATFTISLADVGDITETVGWWDASDSSTITTDGSEVTLATDKSGNSYDLSTTTVNRSGPTIGTVSQNGLNVFEFASSIPNLQVLENDDFAWDQSSSAIAFAMVFRCDDEAQTDQDFLVSGTETANPRIGARRTTSDNLQILTQSASLQSSGGGVTEGQVYLVVLKFNSTNSFIRLDGTERATGNIGTTAFSSLNISGNFNEDQGVEGFIGEVVAFSDLSKTEIIEGYLAHKWGLESNLPTNHPYKSQAPLKSS